MLVPCPYSRCPAHNRPKMWTPIGVGEEEERGNRNRKKKKKKTTEKGLITNPEG